MNPEAQAIAIGDQFSRRVWDEVMRHPGADGDDADAQQWQRISERIVRATVANPGKVGTVGEGKLAWSGGAWGVIFGLRNSKFRPTWEEVGKLLSDHLGIGAPQVVSGADAEARRVVSAPARPAIAELPGGTNGHRPPWLRAFAEKLSLDDGGPYDQVLLIPLRRVTDAEAFRLIDEMAAAREAEKARRYQGAHERQRAETARDLHRAEQASFSEMLAELRAEKRGGYTVPGEAAPRPKEV